MINLSKTTFAVLAFAVFTRLAQAEPASPVIKPSRPAAQAVIPANATPQLAALLTTRNQLMQNQVAFRKQHLNDDPTTWHTAMAQWRKQNAALFQQIQQQALALSQTDSNNEINPTK